MTGYIYSNNAFPISVNFKQETNKHEQYILPINTFNVEGFDIINTQRFNNFHSFLCTYPNTKRDSLAIHLQYSIIWFIDKKTYYPPVNPIKLQQLLSVTSYIIFKMSPTARSSLLPSPSTSLLTTKCVKYMLKSVLGNSLPQLIPLFLKLINQIPYILIDLSKTNTFNNNIYNLNEYTIERNIKYSQILFSPYNLFKSFDFQIINDNEIRSNG